MTALSRRRFLAVSGAALLGARASSRAASASSPDGKALPETFGNASSSPDGKALPCQLAFQVYAVRELCARDFAGTLRAARALGYTGVETGRFYGLDGPALGATVRDAGLDLIALQLYPHTLTEPELARTIRFCHACGCRRINTAWFKGSAENSNDWQLVVNVINHAAEVCAREGIAVAYHNHDQEFRIRFGGQTAWEWLYERFSPQVLQEFDPGWCVLAGGDPLAWLARYPHRNPTAHIMPALTAPSSSNPDGKALPCQNPPPPGACGVGAPTDRADWRRIVPALLADGVRWLVAKPTTHPDSLADLKASFAALTSLIS